MADLIYRQQAIDEIHEDADWLASQGSDWQVERMERDKSILMSLPSVQPEIIRCKDCKYYKYGICMKIGANKSFHGFCDWAERGEQE